MTEPTDLNELARRYIDLWQEHLADLSADGEVAETIARTIELMSGSASAIAAFNRQIAEGANPHAESGGPATGKRSSGAATAGPAHGSANHDVDELASRVAELEKRLSKMESKIGGTGRKPAKRSTKG